MAVMTIERVGIREVVEQYGSNHSCSGIVAV